MIVPRKNPNRSLKFERCSIHSNKNSKIETKRIHLFTNEQVDTVQFARFQINPFFSAQKSLTYERGSSYLRSKRFTMRIREAPGQCVFQILLDFHKFSRRHYGVRSDHHMQNIQRVHILACCQKRIHNVARQTRAHFLLAIRSFEALSFPFRSKCYI